MTCLHLSTDRVSRARLKPHAPVHMHANARKTQTYAAEVPIDGSLPMTVGRLIVVRHHMKSVCFVSVCIILVWMKSTKSSFYMVL